MLLHLGPTTRLMISDETMSFFLLRLWCKIALTWVLVNIVSSKGPDFRLTPKTGVAGSIKPLEAFSCFSNQKVLQRLLRSKMELHTAYDRELFVSCARGAVQDMWHVERNGEPDGTCSWGAGAHFSCCADRGHRALQRGLETQVVSFRMDLVKLKLQSNTCHIEVTDRY